MGFKKAFVVVLGLAACLSWGSAAGQREGRTISLAGIWKFKLDPLSTGVGSNGVQLLPRLPEDITLPGSTDQAGKGTKTQGGTSLRLTRQYEYKGPAWYEKQIFVPAEWKGKVIQLYLERAHWETEVWVNDRRVGRRESLSVPHVYDISSLVRPGGNNSIRIRVDNSRLYDIGFTHALSEETQTNWNGIIGRMELQAWDPVHIEDVQAYPDVAGHKVRLHITIAHPAGAVKGELQCSGATFNTSMHVMVPAVTVPFSGRDSLIVLDTSLYLGDKVLTWDEFDPALYRLSIRVGNDTREVVFGMRQLGTEGTRFTINGRQTFIRGTVNSAEFPLTGYPSMGLEAWRHIFKVCKDYGLNAMRFHSWCPPEAAFDAADEAGMYLQVENCDWRFNIGKDASADGFLRQEADRILQEYGNHPSFTMFCEGNELVGPSVNVFLSGLLDSWKKDPRHLYTGGSGYPVVTGNQYNDYYGARPQHWKEGLNGRFNAAPLNTNYDYAAYVQKFTAPMITHEIGQWCVYPDFDGLSKYSGVLKPFNYELFRESLRDHHMLELAPFFTTASGKFQVIQKKEEIESYLRTPGMGGYHLLQLNDFPGQGTAPVGVVDDFWDPKPYTSGGEFSHFQSALVPLLRTSSFTWTNDQTFAGRMEFANFGKAPLKKAVVRWSLEYADGKVYASGKTVGDIPLGGPIRLDSIRAPLTHVAAASELTFRMRLDGTNVYNEWKIWVYPHVLPVVDTAGVRIAYEWNDEVKSWLRQGARVLLLADTSLIRSKASPVFSGISWNTVWSGMPPDLLGILCDPKHPAFGSFPTEFHSNWQWWDLVRHSKPMVLDGLPAGVTPLVQMIPDWNHNDKIGLVWEAKVGRGKLLVSAIDLRDDLSHRPVAAQFLYSLKKYVAGPAFEPKDSLGAEMIDSLFEKPKSLANVKFALQQKWPNNRTINLVFHGHSVPAGYGRTPDVNTFDSYPYQVLKELKQLYPYAVINVIVTAIGGENSTQGAERFERDVLIHRPDVLFIDYALNDRKIGLGQARKNMEAMIQRALREGIPVILMTPSADVNVPLLQPHNELEQFADQIKELAAKYGVGLADSYGQFRKIEEQGKDIHAYMAQSNHPNAMGHALIAAEIMKYFRP
ncbi:MAG TPA: GDSL-type esterase/lipase family protein [Puia sp.]|nr:GDSL-type esterase/lipase family protein [Puia sp.]